MQALKFISRIQKNVYKHEHLPDILSFDQTRSQLMCRAKHWVSRPCSQWQTNRAKDHFISVPTASQMPGLEHHHNWRITKRSHVIQSHNQPKLQLHTGAQAARNGQEKRRAWVHLSSSDDSSSESEELGGLTWTTIWVDERFSRARQASSESGFSSRCTSRSVLTFRSRGVSTSEM